MAFFPGWRSCWSGTPGWPDAVNCPTVLWPTGSSPFIVWLVPAALCRCPSLDKTYVGGLRPWRCRPSFLRSGRPTKYIFAPPIEKRNRSEAFFSSLHCPNMAYSSNRLTHPSKSGLLVPVPGATWLESMPGNRT